MLITHRDAGKSPLWGTGVPSLLPFCFSGIKEAKMMNPQNKQRIRLKSTDASSFDLRTPELSDKEGLVLHPAEQSSSFDILELNCGCNKSASAAMKWEPKAFPIIGEPLQKHQSLDWSSVLFSSNPGSVAGGYFNSKGPIMRTKSTSFELMQQRDPKELDTKENVLCLESQPHNSCLERAQNAMRVSSAELNYSLPSNSQHQLCQASNAKQQASSAFKVHSYTSLEDPFCSSLSRSSTGSKMSLDLPERPDGTVLPRSPLPASPTTLFSYNNAHNSLALSPPTGFPPPLDQDKAVVGKVFLRVCVTFYISLGFYRRCGCFSSLPRTRHLSLLLSPSSFSSSKK